MLAAVARGAPSVGLAPLSAETKLAAAEAKAAMDRLQSLDQKVQEAEMRENSRLRALNDSLTRQIEAMQVTIRELYGQVQIIRNVPPPTQVPPGR